MIGMRDWYFKSKMNSVENDLQKAFKDDEVNLSIINMKAG